MEHGGRKRAAPPLATRRVRRSKTPAAARNARLPPQSKSFGYAKFISDDDCVLADVILKKSEEPVAAGAQNEDAVQALADIYNLLDTAEPDFKADGDQL